MRPNDLVRALAVVAALFCASGCAMDVDAGGKAKTDIKEDDPLAVTADVAAGSLDDIHRTIVVRSCAGQPGLCHSGQFEPNLSTPALMYENLALRPSLERIKQLRVAPGDPGQSLLMDKLNNHDVISQMPLGAEPLPPEEIAMFEAWIAGGALRRPGAEPPPVLNNPPAEPQVGVFDQAGTRLDAAGPFTVAPMTPLTFRASVQDFETEDQAIPFFAFVLQTADGKSVVLTPGADDPTTGAASYDGASPPEGQGDVLNWRFDMTLPSTITLEDEAGNTTDVPSAGLVFSVVALYIDDLPDKGGMIAFGQFLDLVKVQP